MWPLGTWGLCELMEERDSGAEMHTALASGSYWARRVPVLVTTMVQQDFIVLTPGQPMLAAGLSQYLLRVSGQQRLQEGRNIVLSSLISPIPCNKAIPLHLIGMSPSWLLPEVAEHRLHALVFSDLYLSECFKYISLSGMSIFEEGR